MDAELVDACRRTGEDSLVSYQDIEQVGFPMELDGKFLFGNDL